MKKEHVIFLVLLLLGGAWLTYRAVSSSTPQWGFYEERPDKSTADLTRAAAEERLASSDSAVRDSVKISPWRALGIFVAAFFTLALFSFLYRDNPFYKFAEHAFVGISAAYWMVVAFWAVLVPNLYAKLFPYATKFTLLPGLDINETVKELAVKSPFRGMVSYETAVGHGFNASLIQQMDLLYWIPAILGIMLLWRLMPKGTWIARWPLAFIIGTTAGIRLTGFIESDFIAQISATILPFYDPVHGAGGGVDAGKTFYQSMNNVLIAIGVITGLIYFFFSTEHKGMVGRAARVGIWVLMITFGAGFGMTVMGRIALLVSRFEFLTFEWLDIRTG